MHANNKQVVVVGAGPVGLTLAAELARHGICCRIIDKAAAASVHSKAAGVHARTMEQFRDMGVVKSVLNRGTKVIAINFYTGDRRLVRIPYDLIESAFPYEIFLAQSETERILTDHLAGFGIAVERQWEITRFKQTASGLVVEAKNADGRREKWKTSWLIGCDGAHSRVRQEAGLAFEGTSFTDWFYLADVVVDWRLPNNEIQIFLHLKGVLVFFPLSASERRIRVVASVGGPDRTQDVTDPTIEDIQALVSERGPGGIRVSNPEWLTTFRIHHRKVKRYQTGRVFLAGDAAHIHSPAGGQGMNTGLQDAYNLAWKLALVLQDRANPAILDSYTTERQPVARRVIDFTHWTTRMVMLKNPVWQTIRNHILARVLSRKWIQKRVAGFLSEIDVQYGHSPIVGQDWKVWGGGLKPGARAVDARLKAASSGEMTQLFEIGRGTAHQLLLFEGRRIGAGVLEHLAGIAKTVRSSYGDLVSAHLIVSADSEPTGIGWDGSIFFDPHNDAHACYGAEEACLYLIRPDGYVAYRSRPPEIKSLRRYLGGVYRG